MKKPQNSPPGNKRQLGTDKEDEALAFLKRQGFKLRTRNFFCRFGEIDLIVESPKQLVFVEVRYRQNKHYGGAALSVTPSKQAKLLRSAEYYLQLHPECLNKICRIDVIAIEGSDIQWIHNAIER